MQRLGRIRVFVMRLRRVVFGMLLGVWALPALARLGGDAASIDIDALALGAASSERVSTTTAYVVHQIRGGNGTAVREYLSVGGVVFAVAWEGPLMPDLRQILGERFAVLERAQRGKEGVQRPFGVADAELVVVSTGRMRSFTGRAWVPALVPAGVTPADLW